MVSVNLCKVGKNHFVKSCINIIFRCISLWIDTLGSNIAALNHVNGTALPDILQMHIPELQVSTTR